METKWKRGGKKGNKTRCHGLHLHKGFSFRTHPFSSVWQLLIAERQSLPAKIKVKKKNKKKQTRNMFHPRRHTADNSLPVVTFFFYFVLVCLLFFFSPPQQPEERVRLPWCVSAPVTPRWRWRWGWMGVDGGGGGGGGGWGWMAVDGGGGGWRWMGVDGGQSQSHAILH